MTIETKAIKFKRFEDGNRLRKKNKNSNNGLVSIITVCLNSSDTIARTICSVREQTYENIEHIIIDGGSTDGTLDIIKKNIQHIEYVVSESDTGLYNAINKGISFSTGEFILILNSDDWYTKDAVQNLVDTFRNSDSDFVGALSKYATEKEINELESMPFDHSMYFAMSLRHETLLIPKKIYLEIGTYKEEYKIISDFEFSIRLFEHGYRYYESPRRLLNFSLSGISSTEPKLARIEHKHFLKNKFPFLNPEDLEVLSNENHITERNLYTIQEKHRKKTVFNKACHYYAKRRAFNLSNFNKNISNIYKYQVSIIIPAYNSEKSICKCIKSVLQEKKVSIEILVINDSSSDNTKQVVKNIISENKNTNAIIRILSNKRNIGAAGSRNIGIANSSGNYIFFVDSDDEIYPDSLAKLLNSATKNSADITKGNMKAAYADSTIEHYKGIYIDGNQQSITTEHKHKLLTTTEGHVTCLYENNFISNLLYPEDLSMGEDSLFLIKAFLYAKTINCVATDVYKYNQNSNSAMYNYTLQNYRDELEWRKRASKLLENSKLYHLSLHYIYDYWNEQQFEKLRLSKFTNILNEFKKEYKKFVEETKFLPQPSKKAPITTRLFLDIYSNEINTCRKSILILSSSKHGGAGLAATRLYKSLRSKNNGKVNILTRSCLTSPLKVYEQSNIRNNSYTNTWFSLTTNDKNKQDELLASCDEYDIINIHWASDFVSLDTIQSLIKLNKTVILTFHDYWYFTGGCHYPAGCENYYNIGCSSCPQIKPYKTIEMRVQSDYQKKIKILASPNVFFTSPSSYILNQLSRIGIDTAKDRSFLLRNPYDPSNELISNTAKTTNSFIIICGDHDERRKGISILLDAFEKIESRKIRMNLSVVGNISNEIEKKLNDLKFISTTFHGSVSDTDVIEKILSEHRYIIQSSFDDNWPNVLVESALCGCLPIVFPGHGCEEFAAQYGLQSQVCDNITSNSLADKIIQVLNRPTNDNANYRLKKIQYDHASSTIFKNFLSILSVIEKNDYPLPRTIINNTAQKKTSLKQFIEGRKIRIRQDMLPLASSYLAILSRLRNNANVIISLDSQEKKLQTVDIKSLQAFSLQNGRSLEIELSHLINGAITLTIPNNSRSIIIIAPDTYYGINYFTIQVTK